MNSLDKQYQELLQDILDNGVKKEDRTGTGTISVFGRQIRHKMSDGFPLLTTKKMPFKTIVTELLWFLRGDTNIKFLVDNNCHIWDGDAYKAYEKSYEKGKHLEGSGLLWMSKETKETFIYRIKTDDGFAKKWGELGPIYGKQWRSWETYDFSIDNDFGNNEFGGGWNIRKIDQIQNLINDLKTNPDSRRLMVNAWNVGELDQTVLPPCHYGFQVYTRELNEYEKQELYFTKHPEKESDTKFISDEDFKEILKGPQRAISLMWNQRSCDFPLGIPFNIASYGLLLEIIAKAVNMVPEELIGNLGDCHIYLNQIDGCKEQIGRKYTHEERTELLKQEMGVERYEKAVNELMAFGGGLSEYYDSYKIPYTTREPFSLPTLVFNPIFLSNLEHKGFDEAINGQVNFKVENYQSHQGIKFPLSN